MKTFQYVCVISAKGKFQARTLKVKDNENILGVLRTKQLPLVILQPCGTGKEAEQLAEKFNEDYKKNGVYLEEYKAGMEKEPIDIREMV